MLCKLAKHKFQQFQLILLDLLSKMCNISITLSLWNMEFSKNCPISINFNKGRAHNINMVHLECAHTLWVNLLSHSHYIHDSLLVSYICLQWHSGYSDTFAWAQGCHCQQRWTGTWTVNIFIQIEEGGDLWLWCYPIRQSTTKTPRRSRNVYLGINCINRNLLTSSREDCSNT